MQTDGGEKAAEDQGSRLPTAARAAERGTVVPGESSTSLSPSAGRRTSNPYMPGAAGEAPPKAAFEAAFDPKELDTACPICLKIVMPLHSDLYKGACCKQLYHAGCWTRSAWGQLRQEADPTKNFKCPKCSMPPASREVASSIRQEMYEMLRDSSSDEDEPPPPPRELTAAEREKRDLLGQGSDDEDAPTEAGVDDGRFHRMRMTMAGAGLSGAKAALEELRTPGRKVDLAWFRKSGMKIDTLLNQYTLKELYARGVTKWKHLLSLGFAARHLPILANMGQIPQLVAYYHVTAPAIRRDLRVTLRDLSGLHLSATTMAQLEFNAHELCLMNLTKDHFKSFQGVPMGEWISRMGLTPFHLLLLKFKNKDFRPGYLGSSWDIIGMAKMMKMDINTADRLGLKITQAPRRGAPRRGPVPGRRGIPGRYHRGGAPRRRAYDPRRY